MTNRPSHIVLPVKTAWPDSLYRPRWPNGPLPIAAAPLVGTVASGTLTNAPAGFIPATGFTSSGTFADGQSFTITKAGAFGTKPNAVKPCWYWNPGKDATTALNALSRNTVWATDTGNGPQFGAILNNVVNTGSTSSYEVNSSNAGAPAIIDGMSLGANPSKSRVWSKWRTNWNGVDAFALTSPGQWNLKGKRCWSGVSGSAHDYKTGFGDSNSSDNPVMFYENTDPGGNHDITGGSLPKNIWLTENISLIQGTTNNADTVTKYYANGKLLTTYTNVGFADAAHSTNGVNCTAALTRWYAEQLQSVPSGLKFFYDILIVEDSLCAVFITDQPTWDETVTHAEEMQITTGWTTDSVQITVRKGAHASLVGKYVYVVLSDGTIVGPCGHG